MKTRISAPAHPSATDIGRVSGLVTRAWQIDRQTNTRRCAFYRVTRKAVTRKDMRASWKGSDEEEEEEAEEEKEKEQVAYFLGKKFIAFVI